MKKTVCELFAGVGGFRVGLNEVKLNKNGKTIEKDNFEFVWANQWEPSRKVQHAFNCYQFRFGESIYHSNIDISKVDKEQIPDHTLLCGGFPCQDYSVARTLSNEKGIEGKKGVLWWQIYEILKIKKPPFVLLENVDRLIKSPSKQRGRDFGVMLRCSHDLGYSVEWRVINAAHYGHVQQRRRVYIFAYKTNTKYYRNKSKFSNVEIMLSKGMFAETFPVENSFKNLNEINISNAKYRDLHTLSEKFNFKFLNTGYLKDGIIYTFDTTPKYIKPKTLYNIIEKDNLESIYFLNDKIEKFKYLKGSKKIPREKNGVKYIYSEGSMSFPDNLNLPGRTMLTSEGSVNR